MKNRILKLIALVLAILMAVSVFASCAKDTSKTKKKKIIKKVIVSQSADDDEEDEEEEEEEWEDEDEYENDDIELSLGYDDDTVYNINDLLQRDSETYVLNSYNDEDPLCTTFRGMTGTCYFPSFSLDRDPNGRYYTDEMFDVELTRLKNAGIKYVRTCFWSDWMYTGDDSNPWDTETDTMLKFYDWCKKLDSYGLKVIIVLGWGYPAMLMGGSTYLIEVPYLMPRLLDENGNSIVVEQWGNYFEVMDYQLQNERYAEWGVTTAKALKAHGVTNANNFLLFTEPHEDGGTAPGAFWEYQIDTFSALHRALTAAGLRDDITLIGPNQSCTTPRFGLASKFMENASGKNYEGHVEPSVASQVFDIYTSHNYPAGQASTDDIYDKASTNYNGWMDKMDNFGLRYKKEVWMDEFGGDGDMYNRASDSNEDTFLGTQYGQCMIASFNSGMSAIMLWQLFDMNWPDYYGSGGEYKYGVQISGAARSLYNSEIPFPNYYAITLFSRYTGDQNGKTYRSETDDASSLYFSTIELEDGGWSIAVVNMSTDTKTFDVNFRRSLGGVTLYRYMYTPGSVKPTTAAKIITADKIYKNVDKDLIDTIEGGATVIYSTIKNFG